jgi:flagellar protein FlaG
MDVSKLNSAEKAFQPSNQTPVQKEVAKAVENTKIQQQELEQIEDNHDKQKIQKELSSLTKKLNDEISLLSTDIKFGFSDDINGLFINVIDVKSDRILRQFPSEDAVDIMSKMRELVGMLFDTKG